ncbi:hypothetical protein K493DRAFT_315934 [Basidiobolus meristosporus CBS 931.73]|uniref:Uncharacterized protein n=1 Tax=Basidiobolus meristosporus CBS 931.73 TaxID=1314790 RepID=A0A1Y1Y7K8_9FUNG|nr:hypothetical protein K493DRAFT_315934 [Basidiobolus meristosporus CBS 931.73]|eukprot:ORX93564.1 hypothetical protein K493DRAFT_315934 [Basidiobolus meristosporus CBS 931.73]
MTFMSYITAFLQPQPILSTIFTGLGGWCVLFPRQILRLSFLYTPPEVEKVVEKKEVTSTDKWDKFHVLLTQCFGAQALLCGILLGNAVLTPRTYKVFGAAIVPFLYFDYYYFFKKPLFTRFIGLDLLGNIFMIIACYIGAKKALPKP